MRNRRSSRAYGRPGPPSAVGKRPPSESLELTVEALGSQGDGIARWQGALVYLPFTVPGDRVRVEIGARRGDGHEGRVVAHLVEAPHRTVPVCGHFGSCGGCALQHLAADDYRAVKLGALHAALIRVGIDPAVVAPLRSVPPARRRARLGLMRPRDLTVAVAVGFRERFRHRLVDLAECQVLEPALFALVEPLRRAAVEFLPPGGAAEAMLTRCDSGVDLLMESATAPDLAALQALSDLAERHDLARIVWRNGRSETLIVERRRVRMVFSGIAVALPPGAFLQASAAAEALLVAEVIAGICEQRPVVDLYAGLGTFTCALAAAGPVHAVEGDPVAIAALTRAAASLPQITTERRNLDRDPLSLGELSRFAAAVFDPPRAGARRQAEALAAADLDTVVAVSCNPATFARDAACLVAGGFRLERVAPIDQFVFTPHLELVATFRR